MWGNPALFDRANSFENNVEKMSIFRKKEI